MCVHACVHAFVNFFFKKTSPQKLLTGLLPNFMGAQAPLVFDDPDKRSLFETLWEKKKMLGTSIFFPAFSPFPSMFSTLSEKNFTI